MECVFLADHQRLNYAPPGVEEEAEPETAASNPKLHQMSDQNLTSTTFSPAGRSVDGPELENES